MSDFFAEKNWNEFKNYYLWKRRLFQFEKIYIEWKSVFGSNILFVDFNSVKQNPKNELKKIWKFLNISNEFISQEMLQGKNKTKINYWPDEHKQYIEELFKEDIAWYSHTFPNLIN